MRASKIEWTDATWNPVRGCSRVSPGCVNCYAERRAARFAGLGMGPAEFTARSEGKDLPPFFGFVTEKKQWSGKVELIEATLAAPLYWKSPKKIFVNSMSDLFHEALPDEAIDRVFAVMTLCPQHTFQILTKRASRMLKWSPRFEGVMTAMRHMGIDVAAIRWPLPNVWLGVSVEDQATADERIPLLLQTPAAIRFVSYEPALGPVDFTRLYGKINIGNHVDMCVDSMAGRYAPAWRGRNTVVTRRDSEIAKLDWIIAGGESGPGARPCRMEWIRSVMEQCSAQAVPIFFKQAGSFPCVDYFTQGPLQDWAVSGKYTRYDHGIGVFADGRIGPGESVLRVHLRDRKGGDLAELPAEFHVREFPGKV